MCVNYASLSMYIYDRSTVDIIYEKVAPINPQKLNFLGPLL